MPKLTNNSSYLLRHVWYLLPLIFRFSEKLPTPRRGLTKKDVWDSGVSKVVYTVVPMETPPNRLCFKHYSYYLITLKLDIFEGTIFRGNFFAGTYFSYFYINRKICSRKFFTANYFENHRKHSAIFFCENSLNRKFST